MKERLFKKKNVLNIKPYLCMLHMSKQYRLQVSYMHVALHATVNTFEFTCRITCCNVQLSCFKKK